MTLGLAYAEAFPESVRGMVLRGVFTSTDEKEDDSFPRSQADLAESLQIEISAHGSLLASAIEVEGNVWVFYGWQLSWSS
jgi:hypothetical protein